MRTPVRERRCEVTPPSVLQNRPEMPVLPSAGFRAIPPRPDRGADHPRGRVRHLRLRECAAGRRLRSLLRDRQQRRASVHRLSGRASRSARSSSSRRSPGCPADVASFGLGVVILDLIADAIIVGSLLWGWGVVPATVYAAAVAPIVGLFFNRVDAWSTAAAILAVAAWRKNRPITLGCALAIGAAFKLWPLVLATLLVVPWRARRSVIALTAFTVTAALFAGGALWLAGSKGVLQVLTFRGATGWQIESLVGSLIHLTGSETLRMESGAWRIGTDQRRRVDRDVRGGGANLCLEQLARRPARSRRRRMARQRVDAARCSPRCSLLSTLIWLAPAAGIAWVEGDTASRRDHRDRDPADADLLESVRERAQRRSPGLADRGAAQRGADRARRQRGRATPTRRSSETARDPLSRAKTWLRVATASSRGTPRASAWPRRRSALRNDSATWPHTTGRQRKNQIASTA